MNDRIDDLIALAALGELDDLEAAELDAAVRDDPAVAADLADALAAAATLQASSVEAPPPSLRASVLDAIAATPQDVGGGPALDDGASWVKDDGASWVKNDGTSWVKNDGTSWVQDGQPRRRRRFAPLLAAAAALLLVVAGAVVVANRDSGGDSVAAVMDAGDVVAMPMTSQMGDLEMWYSAEEDAVVLLGDSMTVPPDDATYQLWVVQDEVAVPLGTFEPDGDGVMAPIRVDGVDPTDSIVGITMEPAGGSETPTLPMLAASA